MTGAAQRPEPARLRVGYLSWVYPVVSMTFVQREVAALRDRGVDVETMAIRPAAELLSRLERDSAAETWTVLPTTAGRLLWCHLRSLLRSPSAFLSTLRLSWLDARALPGRARPARTVFHFAEAVLLAEHLRRRRLDHVHVHGGDVGSHVVRLVAHLERSRQRPRAFTWSLTVHGPGELLWPREHLLEQKIADADLVVAVSEYGRAQLVALTAKEHWGKIQVVHCGVDVPRWPRRIPVPARAPRVLAVGRLHPQKAHHVLIEAVGLLRDRGVAMSVTVVGEGSERPALERLLVDRALTDRVQLVGAVGQADIGDVFRHHDVFCLASVSEGLPVVLMEAMAAGLPVVTTRITGVPELVQDGVTGLLVAPARPDLLADALERVLTDPLLADSLAEAGRSAVTGGFDCTVTARQLERHFRDLLQPLGRRPAGDPVDGRPA